jgi:hypothetical protein
MRAAFWGLALALSAFAALAQSTSYIQIETLVPGDPARFDILVDGNVPAVWSNMGNGSQGVAYPFSVGTHTLTATGAGGTNSAQYQVTISTASGPWAHCNANGTVDITLTLSADCIITFTKKTPPPPPVFSPLPGTLACPYTVSLSDADPSATIYLDSIAGITLPYTNPISVNTSLTIYAFAVNAVGQSAVVSETYICPGEAVQCYVFDDDYTNMAGPSQAIVISGRTTQGEQGKACIPGGQFGVCRKWFGKCSTTVSFAPIFFNVFDDGNSNITGPSDSVFIPATGNQACLTASGHADPPGISSPICRRWFGRAVTSDARNISCSVFNDGSGNQAGPSDATYIPQPIPGPGSACIPDGTAAGTCRRWFGNCSAN